MYILHTSFTRSHTAHSFCNLHLPFFAIHSISIFRFSSVTLFVVSFDISLFFSLSLSPFPSLSMSFSCLFNSFIFFFPCASSRAPPYLLAHRRYLHCAPMSDFISVFFGIDVTKEVLTCKGWRTLLPDVPILPRHTKSHTHPSERRMTLNFLSCAYLVGKKKGGVTFTFHRSTFRERRSPINADTGAHYTTSPSYANCEPP